jgi:putative Mg2+ transporter-C (MgtC) family protein
MAPPSLLLPDVVTRLCWALLLGAGIGFERQWHQKMAGLKTNALVALGAAGFVVFATAAGQGNPSQVSAQIVSGIGFLGAGVIMREGVSVHGLNTAATLWCSAMVDALAGFGMWEAGGVAGALVLLANLVLRPVANRLNTRVQAGNEIESRYAITLTCAAEATARARQALLDAMAAAHVATQGLTTVRIGGQQTQIELTAVSPHAVDTVIEAALAALAGDPGITGTSWRVTRPMPEA